MRIALAGPSGSGKTTLAEFLTKEFGIPFISNSAYDVLSVEQKERLKEQYSYVGSGHRNVIQLSHTKPEFGLDFQNCLLHNRTQLYRENPNMIADRSFIDNVAYYLAQCGAYQPDEVTKDFITRAMLAMDENIDLLIRVRVCNPEETGIENNGSRVDSLIYQRQMDVIFEFAMNEMIKIKPDTKIKLLVIDWWDLNERKEVLREKVGEFIEDYNNKG